MSLQDLFALVLTAMSVEFTVFGFTISLYQFFIFSVLASTVIWIINMFLHRF